MTYRYPGGLIRRTAANTAITGASGVWDLGSQAQAVKNNTWPISGLANPISGSLRFRASNSAYLNRTPASAGNRRTWTWSGWVKRGNVSGSYNDYIFSVETGASERDAIIFDTSDRISIFPNDAIPGWLVTTQVFRDFSSWYHIVVAVDTTQATASNRIKLYVNGVQVTAFGTANYPTQNYDWNVNNTVLHTFGDDAANVPTSLYHFNGYMAEINLIDGQALTPASFGQTSAITGVWEPIKYTGTYGTNGFYLSLSDTSSIGKDFSGRGNNWSPNNFSTANDSTFDLMRDVPTQWAPQGVTDVGGVVRGNYCVLNPIQRYDTSSAAGTYSAGNLIFASGGIPTHAFGTMAIAPGNTDGWYWEGVCTSMDSARTYIGILSPTDGPASVGAPYAFNTKGVLSRTGDYFQTLTNGTSDATYTSYTTNDVVMVAYKNGKLWFGKNGTWMNSGNPAADTGAVSTTLSTSKEWFPYFGYNSTWSTNFGQRPFTYTPPTGFKSLCTTNLPNSNIVKGSDYFNAVLYTGNSSTTQNINTGISPDFVWIKSRTSGTGHHSLIDRVRGDIALNSNQTIVEYSVGDFNMNTDGTIDVPFYANDYSMNTSGNSYVAWNWKAGGTAVTNTSGTITSQVSANPTAGFSIVTYTGNGTSGATVGHGLGVTPSMVILKQRDGTSNWQVKHVSLNANQNLNLNSTAAVDTAPGSGYISAISSTTLTLLNGGSAITNVNTNNGNYVAYCFAPIAGYSAFGSYTGNGSTDGTFVYTGFRPRYIMRKRTDTTAYWVVFDTARNTYNVVGEDLYPNDSLAGSNDFTMDILSNGFKIRGSGANINASGGTYIYAAFAEFPFKNSLAR